MTMLEAGGISSCTVDPTSTADCATVDLLVSDNTTMVWPDTLSFDHRGIASIRVLECWHAITSFAMLTTEWYARKSLVRLQLSAPLCSGYHEFQRAELSHLEHKRRCR